ncbi:hypothetical protein Psed_4495 [Pseudonocardia dioxanivorans CB1190]|uniref:ASCH domain-containing protein n=1 Tax=Pseudonocardia dioxanivorans (strain ATCC 55486 / DSM 44775 / JCM 13855 / CB1190) TaxID=675635 RepID=F4CZH8_PSEUX|nr:hypothetical protein [Pseudonocardia dioxanivorans]AEA26650.1 hypothetical protein Psed_4495 [Pseudonocardia dioxanivorans CB1190]
MLLRRPVLDAVVDGRVTRAYRRWDRPRVKPGSRLRTAVGVLEVTGVEAVDSETLTDDDDRAALDARLARLDRASAHGPWTARTLTLIAENPEVRAPDLAARMGRETLPFKRDVRKLKELGLTKSLPVGYRLSPRGRAYLGR